MYGVIVFLLCQCNKSCMERLNQCQKEVGSLLQRNRCCFMSQQPLPLIKVLLLEFWPHTLKERSRLISLVWCSSDPCDERDRIKCRQKPPCTSLSKRLLDTARGKSRDEEWVLFPLSSLAPEPNERVHGTGLIRFSHKKPYNRMWSPLSRNKCNAISSLPPPRLPPLALFISRPPHTSVLVYTQIWTRLAEGPSASQCLLLVTERGKRCSWQRWSDTVMT